MRPGEGDVYTADELKRMKLFSIDERFAGCSIFGRGINERFLVREDGKKYRIEFAYTLKD
jgi:hypothetical protein